MKKQYTCPMHPEVMSDKSESCPKCGMPLVSVEKTRENKVKTAHCSSCC